MFRSLLKSIVGSTNDRFLKKLQQTVEEINKLESRLVGLSDEELQAETPRLKAALEAGKTLDDILPEAFAAVREASKRVMGMRHYDVQLIGGMVLHQGMIAEMKTGEGKTLVATLPVYLNALAGKGVHVVTVNDYLARRDAKWMGRLYEFLGMTIGCIYHGLTDSQRQRVYGSDITYGTNHEFGFDYLRDNMKFHLSNMVMRPFFYGMVDEVDSILVDEARTPLIISGPAEDSSDYYMQINKLIPRLIDTDYEKDEKQNSVILTDQGIGHIEEMLNEAGLVQGSTLYDVQNIAVVHHVHAALKAHKLFHKDVEYIVKDGQVVIIDEFTGRMMEGRRYSDGLHQAIEAKEEVDIATENQTLASITYQNFFKLYPKLSGMAGTAMTEAPEFEEIYNLRVVEIPPNVTVQRIDEDDEIYLTAQEKYQAVVHQIKECQDRKQPVLVGTTSIEKSELVSDLLTQQGIQHNVLNARHHEQEAYIVADAGRTGIITVATNMAGRGTDIQLGGNWEMRVEKELGHLEEGLDREKAIAQIKEEVLQDRERVRQAGGLFIIGTERHESRRIDNQLRGRAGRQGDPGGSRFYISLEDDLMRIFGGAGVLQERLRKFGAKEGEVISHKWISRAIERSQQKVEERNFDIRKNLLRYDNVMNDQRKIIYTQRKEIMESINIHENVVEIYRDIINTIVHAHAPEKGVAGSAWDFPKLVQESKRLFNQDIDVASRWSIENQLSEAKIIQDMEEIVLGFLDERIEHIGMEESYAAQKNILLRLLDQHWKDHLLTLDHLRHGINLRSYAQSNPLNEYKRESFNLFQSMVEQVKADFVAAFSHFERATDEDDEETDFSHFYESNLEELFGGENGQDPMAILQELSNKLKGRQNMLEVAKGIASDHDDGEEEEDNTASLAEIALAMGDQEVNNEEGAIQESLSVSRNRLCPCGSKKRYKHCHGAF